MKKGLFVALLAALTVSVAAAYGATSTTSGPTKSAAPLTSDNTLVTCGKSRLIGMLAPITGPAASLGAQQVKWFNFFISRFNAKHKNKLKPVFGDTILGGPTGTVEAVKAAQSVGSNARVLGTVGPAGSQEVKATTPALKNSAKIGYVSGSSTDTTLTDGSRAGFFFRTVPPDAVQGANVATYIIKVFKYKRVYIIDDQEAYSTGLADEVQTRLRAAGVTVERDGVSQQQSDFSSLIAKISRTTQLIYIPWQLPPKGQAFGQQLRSAGKANITLMGSDGLFDSAFASLGNVYASSFPTNGKDPLFKAYRKKNKKNDFFGAPSYVAAQVVGEAIDRACKNGTASRAEVRLQIKKTNLKNSLLGLPIKFDKRGDIQRKKFGIWKATSSGVFLPVG
jgi:branched-chain amino acid transport system substrate-binding protein